MEKDASASRMDYPMHCVGLTRAQLPGVLLGRRITGYAVPPRQSSTEAWLLRIYLDGGPVLQFASIPEFAGGWDELGSLRVRLVTVMDQDFALDILKRTTFPPLTVAAIKPLIHEDENIFIESGLVFEFTDGSRAIIAAAIPPGAVSMDAPFTTDPFKPEISPDLYRMGAPLLESHSHGSDIS